MAAAAASAAAASATAIASASACCALAACAAASASACATAAAAAHFDEVDAHARILVDMLVDARTQVWESGSYSAAPLIGVRPPERGQIVLDSGLAQAKRWTVFWRVWSGDFPWVVEQRNIVRRVVRDRREAVIAAVAGE